jgi:hypothetical protein
MNVCQRGPGCKRPQVKAALSAPAPVLLQRLIAGIDEFERVVPVISAGSIGIRQIFQVDVYRARPVFRCRGGFEVDVLPDIHFETFDGSIEVLQFDCAAIFVDGDNLEQVTVDAPIPAANFRDSYPMVFDPGNTREKKRGRIVGSIFELVV